MESDSVCAALFEGGSPGSWRGALWGLNKLSAIWTDTRSIFQCHWVLIELLKWLKTIRWSLLTLSVEPLSGYRFIFLAKTSREKIARLRPKMQDRMVLPGLLGSSVHEQTLVACHLIQSLLLCSTCRLILLWRGYDYTQSMVFVKIIWTSSVRTKVGKCIVQNICTLTLNLTAR